MNRKELLAYKLKMLRKCRDMWRWLSGHPDASKDAYFETLGIKDVPVIGCYMCEYVCRVTPCTSDVLPNADCATHCLILDRVWPTSCMNEGSRYRDWSSTHSIEAAAAIAEACDQAIKDLNGKNRKHPAIR